MKRMALVAAVLAVAACNSAAREKARQDSIAAAMAADSARVADSMRMEQAKADSMKMAEDAKMKAKTGSKSKTR